MDFSQVTPRLLTGGAIASPTDVDALAAAKVTHVVDCRSELDDAPLLAGRFAYLFNPTADDGATKPPSWFQRSLTFALPALAQPAHVLYAHCTAGVNRGPSTLYAVIRALTALPHAAVLDLIHGARPATQGGVRYAGDADVALSALGYVS